MVAEDTEDRLVHIRNRVKSDLYPRPLWRFMLMSVPTTFSTPSLPDLLERFFLSKK
jgi:hypothetical protein